MIATTILAAGDSRHHGQPKQLVPCRGTTLIKAIACEVCASTCEHAAVVLGAHADLIAPELAGIAIAPLANPPWATHVASQLRVAIDWARQRGAAALAIVGCDQPRITAKHLDRLYASWRSTGRSVASRYSGMLGLPAVIDARDFDALLDAGLPMVVDRAAAVAWPDGAFDSTPVSLADVIRRRIS
ncbi:MAG TPA: NTP transferase domain-containing protein [Kofleriaceae bacterium]|jgi:CTP:molybdopterin cytidylyltransferase MocA